MQVSNGERVARVLAAVADIPVAQAMYRFNVGLIGSRVEKLFEQVWRARVCC